MISQTFNFFDVGTKEELISSTRRSYFSPTALSRMYDAAKNPFHHKDFSLVENNTGEFIGKSNKADLRGLGYGDIILITYGSDRGDTPMLVVSTNPLRAIRADGRGGGGPQAEWQISIESDNFIVRLCQFDVREDGLVVPSNPEFPTPDLNFAPPSKENLMIHFNETCPVGSHDMLSEFMQNVERIKKELTFLLPVKHADRFLAEAIAKKARLKELFGLGDDLRRSFELRGVTFLTPFLQKYLSSVVEPATIDFSTAPVMVKMPDGKSLKLTKYLANSPRMEREMHDNTHSFQKARRDITVLLSRSQCVGRSDFMAKLGELLSRTSITLWISANPNDFITSSFGGGFTSCHRPDGEYFSGNISMALDTFTLMGFIGTPGKKTGRMWLYVDPHSVIPLWVHQQKSYGSVPLLARRGIRRGVIKLLSQLHGKEDAVWVHRTRDGAESVSGRGGAGYFDASGYDFTYLKGNKTKLHKQLTFSAAMCLHCGIETLHPRGGHCGKSDCIPRPPVNCVRCGKIIDTHDPRKSRRDRHMCSECAETYEFCFGCGMVHPKSESFTVVHDGDTRHYCSERHIRDAGFLLCRCGRWHGGPRDICVICWSNKTSVCADCGERLLTEQMFEHDGLHFCDRICFMEYDDRRSI